MLHARVGRVAEWGGAEPSRPEYQDPIARQASRSGRRLFGLLLDPDDEWSCWDGNKPNAKRLTDSRAVHACLVDCGLRDNFFRRDI